MFVQMHAAQNHTQTLLFESECLFVSSVLMQIVAEKSRCVKKKKVKTQSSPDIVMEGLTYREARG